MRETGDATTRAWCPGNRKTQPRAVDAWGRTLNLLVLAGWSGGAVLTLSGAALEAPEAVTLGIDFVVAAAALALASLARTAVRLARKNSQAGEPGRLP